MAGIEVNGVGVQREIGVRERASLISVLVGMRIRVNDNAAIAMSVGVNGVSVIVVSGPIRVRNISVVLIGRICVIAMAAVQMVRVGHVAMVLVRGRFALVNVIAMLHIPEVLVRRVLRRAI